MFEPNETFKQLRLTDEDLAALDDGQDWWKPGDAVTIGGYAPDDNHPNPGIDLVVNNAVHDNWTDWSSLPGDIRARLVNG